MGRNHGQAIILSAIIASGLLIAFGVWWTHGGANEWTARQELDAGPRPFRTASEWDTGAVTVFISEASLDADPMESDEFTDLLAQVDAISREHGFEVYLVLHANDEPVD